MPLAEALAFARQIALALEAAHEAGIVHRDSRTFTLGPPSARRAYDVTLDGKFIGVATAGTAPSATGLAQTVAAQMKINVVLNWFEELKQRVPR